MEKKKFDETIEEIPNLNELRKSEIKMHSSTLDCNTDEDWDKKGKLINNYYAKKFRKIEKKKK